MTNAMEAVWQHVQQETTDELAGGERHHLGLAILPVVFPSKTNLAVREGHYSTVGDCDPVV